MSNQPGTLYIVATPIGHLDDWSARAVAVLRAVDLVLVEDSRHSARLFAHHGLHPTVWAMHEHNEHARIDAVVRRLDMGQSVALISDAGTPLISDPGFPLVRAVRAHGGRVVAVPGPCALIAALSVSGLPTDSFVFQGFLPAKAAARQASLQPFRQEPRTVVLYESCHRIRELLDDIVQVLGEQRGVVVARELTKRYEEVLSADARTVRHLLDDPDKVRGEFVVLLAGAEIEPQDQSTDLDAWLAALVAAELPLAQMVRIAQQATGRPHRWLYRRFLALRGVANDDAEGCDRVN